MESFITYGLIGIAVALVMGFLNRQAGKSIETPIDGKFELRLSKMYWYIGIGGLLLGLTLFIYIAVTLIPDGVYIGLFMFTLFGGLGFICAIWYKNHRLVFDEITIFGTTVYGKSSELKWEDIEDIKFSAISGLLIIKDKHGTKVKAHQHLVGLSKLVELIEQKTKWKARDLKIPIVKQYTA